jgi:ketosteroid isomerase-like protein
MIDNTRRRIGAHCSWVFAAVFCLGSMSLRAEDAAAVADKQLRTLEADLAAALSAVDVDRLSQLWADDFVSTMADGRVTTGKARLEAFRAKKPDAVSRVTNENQKLDVHVHGDWALILVTSSWIAAGKPVGDPYQATHIWAKRDGRWQLVAAHISEVKP